MPTPTGVLPAPVAEAFRAGLFDMPEHALPTGTSAVQTTWRIPIILVGFTDAPLTHVAAEYEVSCFDTTGALPTGSVAEYYRWVSGNRLRMSGRVVATVSLPHPRDYYGYSSYGLDRQSTPRNMCGLVRDALASCSNSVDWGEFDSDRDGRVDMLWIVHQGVGGETSVDRSTLWSLTARLSAGWESGSAFQTEQRLPGSSSQYYTLDRFSTLPELSAIIPGHRAEIGTFCHEFGHALGLPDLYDTSGLPGPAVNTGPGNWSLMSTGGYGGSGLTPEKPSHMGGWCQLFLGWATTVRPPRDTVLTLRPIARGDPLLELSYQGTARPEHFIVENRYRESFDTSLPSGGLIIYHVDEALITQRLPGNSVNAGANPALQIIEGDGDGDLFAGQNRGDASDPLPGALSVTAIGDETVPHTHTFAGRFTYLAMSSIQQQGENISAVIQVRMPGWEPPREFGSVQPGILDVGRPGRWARTDEERRVFAVRTEFVDGRPQIVMISRLGNLWQPGEVISHSPVGAFDPAIALLPGGDLAALWTDVRNARSQIFYSCRIRGTWTPEQSISQTDGDCHFGAIGADSRGMVETAWIYEKSGLRRICFKRFAYFAPFGTPAAVTGPGENPDPPALEVRPNGASVLVWSDRATAISRIYFARFHPDSGVSPRFALTPQPTASQASPTATLQDDGTLHVAWQVGASGIYELHYQKRRPNLAPVPADTVLDSSGYLQQNPVIAHDDSGGVHLAYENWNGPTPIPSYRLWTAKRGWDIAGAELALPGQSGVMPVPLPHGQSDVTVIYSLDDGVEARWIERRRRMGVSPTLDVAVAGPAAGPFFRLGPNPLRAGEALSLEARGSGASFEIFDVGGRRLAEIPARSAGELRVARLEPARMARWPGGVYFARLSGTRATSRFVILR